MAGELKIKNGTRLKLALDAPLGKEPDFGMLCTFVRNIDESAFLISIPMKDGKALKLDVDQKLLFLHGQGEAKAILAGYADDEVKEGIRRYWKIRRVSEQRQFFQRVDERYKIALGIQYMQDSWMPNEDGEIEKEDGMTLDISAGGLAVFLNRRFEVGEMLELTMPRIGLAPEGQAIPETIAVVCWMREAPRGSVYRNICGLQFRFGDSAERKRMQDYVGYLKKKYKL